MLWFLPTQNVLQPASRRTVGHRRVLARDVRVVAREPGRGLGDRREPVLVVVAAGQEHRPRRRAQRRRVPLRCTSGRSRPAGPSSASRSARRTATRPRSRCRRRARRARSARPPARGPARNASQSGVESRMSSLITPLNGFGIGHLSGSGRGILHTARAMAPHPRRVICLDIAARRDGHGGGAPNGGGRRPASVCSDSFADCAPQRAVAVDLRGPVGRHGAQAVAQAERGEVCGARARRRGASRRTGAARTRTGRPSAGSCRACRRGGGSSSTAGATTR